MASLEHTEPVRISSSYWERYLMNALPVPVVVVAFVLGKNGMSALTAFEALLVVGIGSLLIWLVDSEPARRRQPMELFAGGLLQIGHELVMPNAVLDITPLRIHKGWTRLIQTDYRKESGIATVIVLSKPAPLWMAWTQPRTLRLLLEHHPELLTRVRDERTI